MINWIKYDPANPPEHRKMYLMCEGEDIGLGYLEDNEVFGLSWWDAGETGLWKDVTHYAHINLLGEETDNE
ncbi:hypothetical protein [Paenibacillus sp. P32E]|uniref:hypothetical protein n=1 Tax=Paenibacillus sp. P32E TaxID=1349434 RepID=UPI00093E7D1D|nr:hypothetical protein [Paenibacillus sp. P32E]OKP91405.1 hypothetical protein A3848_09885 [Paenibacillus sp. P32E]